eukprot:557176-Pelagomonas_calceolata.AAC.12
MQAAKDHEHNPWNIVVPTSNRVSINAHSDALWLHKNTPQAHSGPRQEEGNFPSELNCTPYLNGSQ